MADATAKGNRADAGAGPLGLARPRYHVTAPKNWLNDPNGPIKQGGTYHLFYQYNPDAPVWGSPQWGHVSSTDLAHWIDHPPALRPRPTGPDRDGCWSGCARVVNGQPTIFYTGVVETSGRRNEAVCVAHGSLDLLRWEPAPEPLVQTAPAEIDTGYHRDPFIFGDPGAWQMLVGSGLREGQARSGAILHYASPDLASWSYSGILHKRQAGIGPIDTGGLWECPQLFRADDTDVLLYSIQMEGQADPLRYAVADIGILESERFVSKAVARLDYGNVFYAPAITRDDDGRILMWGWIQEKHQRIDTDYAGALSLPRVIDVRNGRISVAPVSELSQLRHLTVGFPRVTDGASISLEHIPDAIGAFELRAEVPRGSRVELCLRVAHRTTYRLAIDDEAQTAVVTSGPFGPFGAPLSARPEGDRSLALYVDGSVIELFLDDQVAVTTRYYDAAATEVMVTGSFLNNVAIYPLDAAMPTRSV